MTSTLLSSLGPMLAAPWRQRRNTGAMWSVALVAVLLLVAPAGLLAWSVSVQFGDHAGRAASLAAERLATNLRDTAASSGACALATLMVAWWAMTVSNLLDQNRPVFARLVPRHPSRLRMALVVAWGIAVGLVTLLVGVRFEAPLACLATSGSAFTLLAVAVRWPLVWLLGVSAPLAVALALHSSSVDPLLAVAQAWWLAQSATITLTAVAASVVVLMSLIQSGGRHHVASDETRRQRIKRFQMRANGVAPMGGVGGKRGALDVLMSRPYDAWWRRVLARPGSSVFGRLMLGLGPSLHWTSVPAAAAGLMLMIFGGFVLIELVGVEWPPARDFAPMALAGVSVGIMPGLLAPSMQLQARLYQTRREQGLLMLLPGAPRGTALSRRLAWQLTGQFVLAWGCAFAAAQLCQHVAFAISPDVDLATLQRLAECFAVGTLPLVALQWRPWARVAAPSSLNAMLPMLLVALVMAAYAAGTKQGWLDETSAMGAIAGVAVVWCALRWWRMASEPEVLPMGRLA